MGVYTNNPISVTSQVVGINITLTEPDTDGDKISDYAERTIFRTDPANASDIPLQLTRSSVECYYGHASGSTNWQLKEGISGLIKSFNIGRGWVTNGMFLPDLAYPNSTIYFGEAIGTTTNNKGGWIYATTISLDSEVDMGKGWAWDKGFLTDFRESSRAVNYFRPKPTAYPDLFAFSHSTNPQHDYLGYGWARPDSFVADLNTSFGSIYQGLVYDFWTSTNMTRTHSLPASRTSTHKKGTLGFGWATAAGFVPSTHTFSYYYYGRLKDSRGISGYSTSSLDFDFGTYQTLGFGYLAGGDFIPNPSGSEPPISAYDQDGDGFIDIPMASDTQFATIDDSEFLQLPVTIGDASGSHTEMYGFDIGSFKYDMPFVNSNEYLFTSVVPLQRGQTYSGALRSLPDSDTDGDYTFLLGGYIQGPSTNLVYVSPEQLGVVVVANFPHSGSQDTNIFGYVNDSGFNSGSKSFTLHVPRVNIRAYRAGILNAPGSEVTRFHEHQPYAVLLPARNQSAPATLTTNDGYVSKLAVDRFLPTGITNGFLRVTISDAKVLALYDHNNNKMPTNLLYNVATISATNPLYQLKSAARTWHALGLTNGSASVTLTYGLTTNSVLCSDTIQFGVIKKEFDVTINTFIPENNVGIPFISDTVFKGDNRGFDKNGSFRTQQKFTVLAFLADDADGLKDGSYVPAVGETFSFEKSSSLDASNNLTSAALADTVKGPPLMIDHDTAEINGMSVLPTRLSDRKVRMLCTVSAGNPLVPTPIRGRVNIDYELTIIMDSTDPLHPAYSISGKFDGFPNYEAYIGDQPVLLYDHGSQTLVSLGPPMEKDETKSTVPNSGAINP